MYAGHTRLPSAPPSSAACVTIKTNTDTRIMSPAVPEVGVLVNGAGDEAAHVLAVAKDVREHPGEAGRRLHRRKADLADVVVLREPKDAAHLRHVCSTCVCVACLAHGGYWPYTYLQQNFRALCRVAKQPSVTQKVSRKWQSILPACR